MIEFYLVLKTNKMFQKLFKSLLYSSTKVRVRIYILVDASGSMQSRKSTVINGYNKFIKEQRELATPHQECFISIYFFNTKLNTIHDNAPLADIPDLTKEDYTPQDLTALRDATADVYQKILENAASSPEDRRICVILTDGEENASEKTSVQELKDLRDKVKTVAEIVYMGSNQDAFENGDHVGATKDTSLSYNDDNLLEAIHSMGNAVGRARSNGEAIEFTRVERDVSSGRGGETFVC